MIKDFSHQNLQGRSFKGQDLTGANFSYADIRGANFTNAVLKGASFSYAKAGLQRHWAIGWMMASLLLSAIAGWLLAIAGAYTGHLLLPQVISKYSLIPAIFVFILLAVSSIANIIQIERAFMAVAMPWYIAAMGAEALVQGLAEDWSIAVGGVLLILISIAPLFVTLLMSAVEPKRKRITLRAIVVVVAVVIAAFIFIVVASALATVKVIPDISDLDLTSPVLCAVLVPQVWLWAVVLARAVAGNLAVAISGFVAVASVLLASRGFASPLASAVAITVVVAVGFVSVYITWRVLAKDENFSGLDFFLIFIPGNTKFCFADLTDANFTSANLKQTNFSKANLTGTCWDGAKNFKQAIFYGSIPSNTEN